jgi:NTP pyrophosphatase (non-canonical NTP hydrolase)
MNFQQYVELAMVTANKTLPRELVFANAALGMCGEYAELGHDLDRYFTGPGSSRLEYKEKAKKELGDVLWYVALAVDQIRAVEHLDFEEYMGNASLHRSIGDYADMVKKHICQGHPLETQAMIELLAVIIGQLRHIASDLDTTLGEVAEGNIAKLKARYPAGFEVTKSVHRKIGDE